MRVRTLDMSKADGYAVTELDVTVADLQRRSLYREGLLYRGFDGDNIEKLLRDGQDKDVPVLHCTTEEEIKDRVWGRGTNPFSHASGHLSPALAVFNPDHLKEYNKFAYTFKDSTNKKAALVAVYRLQYDE